MASFLESLFGGGDPDTGSTDTGSTPSVGSRLFDSGFGDRLQALGMAMASMKPGVGQMDLPRAMELQYKMGQNERSQNAMAAVLAQSGLDPRLAKQLSANPDAAKLMYSLQLQKGMRAAQEEAAKNDPLLGGGAPQAAPPSPVPSAPVPSSGYMPPPGFSGGSTPDVKMPSVDTPILNPPPSGQPNVPPITPPTTSFDNTPVRNVATAPMRAPIPAPQAAPQQAPQAAPQASPTAPQRAQALAGFRNQLQILTFAANNGLAGDAEAAKQRLEIYKKYISPTDQIASMQQAGIDPNSDLGRGIIVGTAKEGTVIGPNGQMSNAPGYIDALREKKAAEFGERYGAKAQFTPQEVSAGPGMGTRFVPQSQVLGGLPTNRFAPTAPQGAAPQGAAPQQGAPAPLGGPAQDVGPQGAAPGPQYAQGGVVAKEPKVFEARQETLAKNMDTMDQQYNARVQAKARLVEIAKVMETFQPGTFAQQKADFIASLRGVGINVPDTATANPAKFQIFLKDATKNVFDDVKSMGGRVLVSEISGLTKANANPELQPEAARAIVGQGIGLIDFENARYQALHNAYIQNPYAYDLSQQNLDFNAKNNLTDYIRKGQANTPALGEPVPRNPADREAGKMYMHPDVNGKPVPGRWNGQQFIPRGAEQMLQGIAAKYGTDSRTFQAAAKQFDAAFPQSKGSAAASVIEMAQ